MTNRKGALRAIYSQQGDRIVKSVQNFEITIASGTNAKTQAITTVNLGRSYVYLNGKRPTASVTFNGNTNMVRPTFDDASTIRVVTDSNVPNDLVVSVQVVEFYPWAAKVYRGSHTQNGSTTFSFTDIPTITGGDFSNWISSQMVLFQVGTTATNNTQNRSQCEGRVYPDTNPFFAIFSRNAAATFSCTFGYCLIVFAPGICKSIQHVQNLFGNTPGIDTVDATIASVITNNTLVYWGGQENNAFEISNLSGELTSSTNFRAQGGQVETNNTRKTAAAVVEFYPRHVKRAAASIAATIASGASQTDVGVSAASKNIIHRTGYHEDAFVVDAREATVFATSSTNVRSQRRTTSTSITRTKGISIGLTA